MSGGEYNLSAKTQGLRSRAAIVCCFCIELAPILYATMPPIMDFPNHLARIWLIAGGVNAAPLDQIYQIDLAEAGANIGVDLAAAALARLYRFSR